ncbi:hypothetical protein K431DRAFT_283989 [Polychaeton citri CBS 116435]|uniref:UBR-type domain-containing protein n=1 Tax=Polychaeton citri CBS 116435 TaxID=1314669 RepID=A0A9P4UQZ2_9PEZI|nr:hypothetical protein K431DRAFT_283989 [Polychaeton citri CBS 116435]
MEALAQQGERRASSLSAVSQTAQEYISSQLQLEADAREALPYQFDTCTKPLGPLRQSIFACLTCTPPPASKYQQFQPAGICYSCSISCHGEHTLVELFTMRNFVCDCGTTRFTNGAPCELRLNPATGRKGGVIGEEAREGNKYNHNYQGKFCGCGEEYDPEREKGTMFQCLGIGTAEDGGCGEDWWHPECLMGLPRHAYTHPMEQGGGTGLTTVNEEGKDNPHQTGGQATKTVDHDDELPLPDGFPAEDDFDHLICYKCADASPWIKQYAGTSGFLAGVPSRPKEDSTLLNSQPSGAEPSGNGPSDKKRKADDEPDREDAQSSKKVRQADGQKPILPETKLSISETTAIPALNKGSTQVKHDSLPPTPPESMSLFLKHNFREHLCRCAQCFPNLKTHPQLLEEEENYEPPLSESDVNDNASAAGRSVNSGSLLDRGEAALNGVDRVRAIEGVMAYNHMRDKVKEFLKPFAESGQAVGAEDIKAYFAKLRGDEITGTGLADGEGGGGAVQGDGRKEQDGY